MTTKKTHIKGSNGRTFCGRVANKNTVFVPDDNPYDVTCGSCQDRRFSDLDLLRKYNYLKKIVKLHKTEKNNLINRCAELITLNYELLEALRDIKIQAYRPEGDNTTYEKLGDLIDLFDGKDIS